MREGGVIFFFAPKIIKLPLIDFKKPIILGYKEIQTRHLIILKDPIFLLCSIFSDM